VFLQRLGKKRRTLDLDAAFEIVINFFFEKMDRSSGWTCFEIGVIPFSIKSVLGALKVLFRTQKKSPRPLPAALLWRIAFFFSSSN
jgi:hypothetical protein